MAYIDNSATKKEIEEAIRGNSVSNIVPTQVNNSVQPVINVNPKDYQRTRIFKTLNLIGSGNSTVYTTSTNEDFYLEKIIASYNKNAACDIATGNSIQVVCTSEDGVGAILIQFPTITLTAEKDTQMVTFPRLKLARNSSIVVSGTFAAGVCVRGCQIFGHTE